MLYCSSGHHNQSTNKYCNECGEKLNELSQSIDSDQELLDAKRSNLSKIAFIVLASAIVIIGAVGIFSSEPRTESYGYSASESDLKPDPIPEKKEEPVVTPWMPEGFIEWNDSIGFKWIDSDCDTYTDYCATAEFISKNGCSSFYVAINLLDSTGAVIGYTNESLPSLSPMQRAKLTFGFYKDAERVQMAEINCY